MAKLDEYCFVVPGNAELQFDALGQRLSYDQAKSAGFSYDTSWREFDEWLDRQIDEMLQRQDDGDKSLAGMIVSFGVADGKAFYMVTNDRPLTLQYIDGEYQVPDYMIRGLRKADVVQLTEQMTAWRRLSRQKRGEING